MLLILFYGVLFSFFCFFVAAGLLTTGKVKKILGGFGEEGWGVNFREVYAEKY